MNAMINPKLLRYEKQQLQEVMGQLHTSRQHLTSYRSSMTMLYVAEEMHYMVVAINQALQHLFDLIEQCQGLLSQLLYLERFSR